MRYVILLLVLIFGVNLSAQITTFAELKAGMIIPESVSNNSAQDQRGYSFGIDLGVNIDESNSVGLSVNYGQNGIDKEVSMNSIYKSGYYSEDESIKGSSSSILTIGVLTRTSNSSLIGFIHPYATLFLGYSYISISGFENMQQSSFPLNNITENDFTVIFSLGLLVPVNELYSGFGIEVDYNIYMMEKENKKNISIKFLYRYNFEI